MVSRLCLILGFVLPLILLGCAPKYFWYREGANAQIFQRESYECERDTRQSGYFGSGFVGAANFQNFYERCLRAKGYRKIAPEEAERIVAAERNALPVIPPAASISSTSSAKPVSRVHLRTASGLHETPHEKAPIRQMLSQGATLTLLQTQDKWYYVATPEGMRRWIPKSAVGQFSYSQ